MQFITMDGSRISGPMGPPGRTPFERPSTITPDSPSKPHPEIPKEPTEPNSDPDKSQPEPDRTPRVPPIEPEK